MFIGYLQALIMMLSWLVFLAGFALASERLSDLCKDNVDAVKLALANTLSADSSFERLSYITQGDTYGEGWHDLMYPIQPTDLPESCAITVYVQSSPTSWYRYGLFLPVNWNQRFLALGNGGFGGGINWLDMGSFMKYGFAVVSTDTGHNSTTGDGRWAFKAPETLTDWGWRALNGSIGAAKQLTERFYGSNISYSYYNGCSTGGRQGLKQIEIDPDTFDGLVIGAPGWDSKSLNPWITRVGIYNLPETAPYHIPWRLFSAMGDLVMEQCDELDGVKDGIISSPDACIPDYTKMLCSNPGIDQSKCLTAAQAEIPAKIYGDYLSSDGELLYPGLSPGCEGQWQAVLSFARTSTFGNHYIRFFLLGKWFWNYTDWDDDIFSLAAATNPGQATADNYDLSTFRDLGHKMVMYHGLSDGLIPPRGSDLYYHSVDNATRGIKPITDWFRYFQVPSMHHCWSTQTSANGPWNFGGEFQSTHLGSDQWSVPGFKDKRHDILLALMDWVENGNPVDSVIATTWNNPLDPTSGLKSQRPLCPYPQVALYDGTGDVNEAASWGCGTKSTSGGNSTTQQSTPKSENGTFLGENIVK